MAEFRRCTRCVMDNASDPTIRFDEHGVCNYCTSALEKRERVYFPNEEGERRFAALADTLKREGEGKPYDCLMGLSGGLDSSYLLFLGVARGLRILTVHIDDGFDTAISKQNLKKLVEKTGVDYTVVAPDAEQFYALSKAYMWAGVPNLAAPQDNVLFAEIYRLMRENGIRYFLSGGNWALECILQHGHTHTAMDTVNLRDINRRFGVTGLDKLRLWTAYRRVTDRLLRGIQSPRPLNWVDYNRDRAFAELAEYCGFEYYGRKHLENTFTAFVQLVWLPRKFGVDKRTSHLSSMIVSGQMTRGEALEQLAGPVCPPELEAECVREVKDRLRITDAEYDAIMRAPAHSHLDYRTDPLLRLASRLRFGV